MLFQYTGVDETGEQKEGTMEAASADAAINGLKRRGYTVTTITPLKRSGSLLDLEITWFEKVSNKEIVIFSRQIATLFEAQVSALRIFRLLASEAENPMLKRILTQVADDLQGGSSISSALDRHPDIFTPFYVSMVEAGEESGKLDETFLYLADYLDRTYEVMSKAKNALIYPAFVIGTFITVMVLMLTLVIPRVSAIIISSGQELPIYTKIVIATSDFMTNNFGILFIGLVIIGVVLWRFLGTESGKQTLDELKLSIPYLGDLYQKLYLSRISDNLSTMIGSGISMVHALEITSRVVDNRVYQEILNTTIEEVIGGSSVSESLSKYEEMPGVLIQMIKVGEETGNLDKILTTLAKFYRREVNNAVDTLINLIEPAMIVLLGIGVAVLLASVLVPIYNISSSI